MKEKIKFKFTGEIALGIGFSCKNCALQRDFLNKCNQCPVVRYNVQHPDNIICVENDTVFADSKAENISVTVEGFRARWLAYKACKQLAKNCSQRQGR